MIGDVLAAMLLVLVGTLYPLVLDYLDMGRLSIGEPFYNITFSPVAIAVGLLMGVGIFSRWKKTDGGWLGRKLLWPAAWSLVAAVAVPLSFGSFEPWAVIGVFTAAWVAVATLQDLWQKAESRQGRWHGLKRQSRSYYGMVLGHLGLAITMAGATVVSNYGVERDVRMSPGDSVMIGDLSYQFVGIGQRQGANFTAQTAEMVVRRDGELVARLFPEKRQYTVQRNIMTEAGIDAGLFRDLFVAVGEQVGDNAWAMRIQYKPLVRWLWLGALFMAAGGFLAIADRRYRIKDKQPAKAPAARPEPVTGASKAPEVSA